MPTRLLREGILDSGRIDKLDAAAEVFYRRLMSKVDDHGLFDARPSVLRAALYPVRIDRISDADICHFLQTCVNSCLLIVYQTSDKKVYLKMLDTNWQVRSKPKFPTPENCIIVNNCLQLCTKSLSLSYTESDTYLVNAITTANGEIVDKSVDNSKNDNQQPEKTETEVNDHNLKSIPQTLALPANLEFARNGITAWLAYKKEKGQAYKPAGLQALFRFLQKIPKDKLVRSIENSMASNSYGIFEVKDSPKPNEDGGWLYEDRKKRGCCTKCGEKLRVENGMKYCAACAPAPPNAKVLAALPELQRIDPREN